MFQILLSDGPQGSLLGPLLFNISINDLFYPIKDAQLLNFINANLLKYVDYLITNLQKEYENAMDWSLLNRMVVNHDKFQSILINRIGKLKDCYELLIDNHKIDSEKSATLFWHQNR